MPDIDKLLALVKKFSEDPKAAKIGADDLSPEFRGLGEAICDLLQMTREVMNFTSEVACGDLLVSVPARGNYLAGPIKELYSKLKHMEWQTDQVAAGDYSQHIDPYGSFSDSFNRITFQLKQRETTINMLSREQFHAAEREKTQTERGTEVLFSSYQAYRDYIDSFQKFRVSYQIMMGEVYDLFNKKEYEKGRQLIAEINDKMGRIVTIRRDYSNHDYINAVLTDVALYCQKNDVEYDALINIPEDFFLDDDVSLGVLNRLVGLMHLLIDMSGGENKSLEVKSSQKSVWLTIIVRFSVGEGTIIQPWSREIAERLEDLQAFSEQSHAIFTQSLSDDRRCFEMVLHIARRNIKI